MSNPRVELLFFDGCPHWRLGDERLAEAIALAGLTDVDVVYTRVESVDDAVRLSFGGSPSFLINGLDPFPSKAQTGGLTCRLYPTGDGTQGSPTVESLARALHAATPTPAPTPAPANARIGGAFLPR